MSSSDTVLVINGTTVGTKIELADARFRILEEMVGGQPIRRNLRPGVYSLRFEELGAVAFSYVVVRPGTQTSVQAPGFWFATSAPYAGTSTTHEWHEQPAAQLPLRQLGIGGFVTVFAREVRTWAEAPGARRRAGDPELMSICRNPRGRYAERPDDWEPTDPGAGLAVHDADGLLVAGLAGSGSRDEHWAGVALEVNPGCYRLRFADPRGVPCELPVVVSRDWQTSVFLRCSTVDGKAWADQSTATISITRPGAFDPRSEAGRFEARIQEIERARRTVAMSFEVPDAWVAERPLLGVCLGHMALRSGSDREAGKMLHSVQSLLGDHPDVAALRLAIDPNARIDPVRIPPMCAASWQSIVRASYRETPVTRNSWLDHIASTASAAWPWLTWSKQTEQGEPEPPRSEWTPALVQALLKIAEVPETVRGRLSPLAARIVETMHSAPKPLLGALEVDPGRPPWDETALGLHLFVPRCTLQRGVDEVRERFIADRVLLVNPAVIRWVQLVSETNPSDAATMAELASLGQLDAHLAVAAGELWQRVGNFRRAASCFERALDRDPYDDVALRGLVAALERLDDRPALAAAMATSGERKGNIDMLRAAARLFEELGDARSAIAAYRSVDYASGHSDKEALRSLARLYEEVGSWDALVVVLRRLTGDASNEEARALLVRAAGIYQRQLGLVDEAEALYRQALDFGPDEQAFAALERIYSTADQWNDVASLLASQLSTMPAELDRTAVNARLDEARRLAEPADYRNRRGYDPRHLGVELALPEVLQRRIARPESAPDGLLRYNGFSLVIDADSQLAVFAAANLTGGAGDPVQVQRWRPDPRLSFDSMQWAASTAAGPLVAWLGDYEPPDDRTCVTNCVPHGATLARARYWPTVEGRLLRNSSRSRLTQFVGPVLDDIDRIRQRYWKVLAWADNSRLAAIGVGVVLVEGDEVVREFRVSLENIARAAGIQFPGSLLRADTIDRKRGSEYLIESDADLLPVLRPLDSR